MRAFKKIEEADITTVFGDEDIFYMEPNQPLANWPSACLPSISTHSAFQAREELLLLKEKWGLNTARVRIVADEKFLDSEGVLEAARIARDIDVSILAVAPLDWSCITLLSSIGVAAVEIQVSIPGIETGIQRRELLLRIINDVDCPVVVSGLLDEQDIAWARNNGVTAYFIG